MTRLERGITFKRLTTDQEEILELWAKVAGFFNIPKPEVVSGFENIPLRPPYIVAANHRGWAEVLSLWETWPDWIYFMTRDINFKIPILKYYCQKAGMLPVKRGKVDRNALQWADKILKQGKVLGMMIEGTRGRGDQLTQNKPPKRGTARIAIRAKVKILPVAVVGTENYAPLVDVEPWRLPGQALRLKTSSNQPPIKLAIGEEIDEHLIDSVDSKRLTGIVSMRIKRLVSLLES